MKLLMACVVLILALLATGCDQMGIGNKMVTNTSNVNVIATSEGVPVQVLDQAGNWINVGQASPALLASRDILYINGRYSYTGLAGNVKYIE
jgi:hypothetical protein